MDTEDVILRPMNNGDDDVPSVDLSYWKLWICV